MPRTIKEQTISQFWIQYPRWTKAACSYKVSPLCAGLNQYFVLVLLNGGALLWVMRADCGLRDKQACRQTLAACLLTGLCEDTTRRILYGRAISTKTQPEHDEWRPILTLSSSAHVKRSVSQLLAQNSSHHGFTHVHWGLSKTTCVLIALGYFVWVGGLTQPARESFKDVFTKDKCVFAASTRLFQTAKEWKEKH